MIESELYQSEKKFKELLENIKSGVVIYETIDNGENFTIREMNRAGLAICEISRKEAIGKNLTELFPKIDEFGFIDALRRVWKTGKSEHSPTALYKDDRVHSWTEMYTYKLPSGKVATIFETQTKQIEAEELFESKQLLEMTLNSLHHSIFILNAEIPPRIIKCNPSCEKTFGYHQEEFMNQTTAFLHIDNDSLKEFQNYLYPEIERSGYIQNFEYKMKRKDGSIFPTEHSIIPLNNKQGERIGWVSVVSDISERKIVEQRLRESEEKYRKAYYQANLYRDIFAHDINNILQNISSSVELSSLYIHNPEKLGTIKELYEIIDEQVNRAKKLILNMGKITELDESEIILEKMDANRVLEKAIEFLQSSFQTRTINIHLNTPTKRNYVYANNLLLDVFENILINAVRHNNKSKIEITIDISKEEKKDKDYIKMQFKDNGVGISDSRKKTIFERGTLKRQKSKGMGLGLSLVKKIVDIYNGDIWVEDRIPGDYKQGSNFIILIPSNH
ncbi:MAG: PAS domain-containing sensor histidine kinase [Promethearchaeota archaeon]|nr:MAG: PAS domain-containing sensor histidine kinase [Candidatus Lokiarchaeota archaeon]